MKTSTDLEIAKQLEDLWQTIDKGITIAKEAIIKSQEIQTINQGDEKKFTKIKVEIFQVADEVRKTSQFISNLSSDLENKTQSAENAADTLSSQLTQFAEYQSNLERLHQKLVIIVASITTAQSQIQQFEQKLPEFTQKIPQKLAEIKKLTSQVADDKNIILELSQQIQEQESQIQEINPQLQKLQEAIEILKNQDDSQIHITNLETENQALNNQIKSNKQEIERLHKRLENQSKRQQNFQSWLLGISFMIATTLAVAILH